MEYKVLEQDGIENTGIDGAEFNYFCAGNKSGRISKVLNECLAASPSTNSIMVSTGELLIHGFRVKITTPFSKTFASFPASDTTYYIIVGITVSSDKEVTSYITCEEKRLLTKQEIFRTEQGTYEEVLASFVLTPAGTVVGMKMEMGFIMSGPTVVDTVYAGEDERGGYRYTQLYSNGSTATFSTPRGPMGPQGPTGSTGPIGPQGLTGPRGPVGAKLVSTSYVGTDSNGGYVYEQLFDDGTKSRFTTPQGPQGPQGVQGERGATGSKLSSLKPVEVNADGSYTYEMTFDDGTTARFTAPAGPIGPQGERGPQGEQGVQGIAGPVGPAGPIGPQGLTGPRGPVGAKLVSTSYVGTDSNGGYVYEQLFDDGTKSRFTTPQGPQGPQGVQGERGYTGATGERGPTGAKLVSMSYVGIDSDGGYRYKQTFDDGTSAEFVAPQGPTGPRGLTGPAGPTGSKLVSMNYVGEDPKGGYTYEMTFDDGTTARFTAPRGDNDYLYSIIQDLSNEATSIDICVYDGDTVSLANLVGVTSVDWGDGTINNETTHTYTVNDHEIDGYPTLKIFGCVELGRITGSQGLGSTIKIGNSVKKILSNAFNWGYNGGYFCKNLIIGSSVTSIGAKAFYLPTVEKIIYNAASCEDLTGSSPAIQSEAASNKNGAEIIIGKTVEHLPSRLFGGGSSSETVETRNITFEDGSALKSVGQYALPNSYKISGKIFIPRLRWEEFNQIKEMEQYLNLLETFALQSDVKSLVEQNNASISQQIEDNAATLSQKIETNKNELSQQIQESVKKLYMHRPRYTSAEQTTPIFLQPIYSYSQDKLETPEALKDAMHGSIIFGTDMNNQFKVLEFYTISNSTYVGVKVDNKVQTESELVDYVFEV